MTEPKNTAATEPQPSYINQVCKDCRAFTKNPGYCKEECNYKARKAPACEKFGRRK